MLTLESPLSKISINLIFLNVLFILMLFFLLASVNSGGTGDVYEGYGLMSLYLVFKSSALIIYTIIFLGYGFIKKELKLTTLFWLAYGILLLSLTLTMGEPVAPPTDPRDWGYDEIKGNIILMNFDCALILLLSVIISTIALFQKAKKAYISLPLNLALLLLYLYSLTSGWTGILNS